MQRMLAEVPTQRFDAYLDEALLPLGLDVLGAFALGGRRRPCTEERRPADQ